MKNWVMLSILRLLERFFSFSQALLARWNVYKKTTLSLSQKNQTK